MMGNFVSSEIAIGITIIGLCVLILAQLWRMSEDDMHILIENGVLYVDNWKFSLVGAGNGNRFESGKYPVELREHPAHGCRMPYAVGFGWIGGHTDCDAVLGDVRGRYALLADILAQERLCLRVSDALRSRARVTLEVKN